MSRATEDLMAALHGALAEEMMDRLKSGQASPSDLNAIRQFLKDNGINADGAKDPAIKSLADDLPDLGNVTPLYGG
jgi:hypothetical protein